MQVHPPTFNQPWHSAAAREEEAAAAPAAAPAALAHPETEAILQDAAPLRALALEKLPASSHGPTEIPPQVLAAFHARSPCSCLDESCGISSLWGIWCNLPIFDALWRCL